MNIGIEPYLIKAGMKVIEDVIDNKNNIIAKGNTVLTQKMATDIQSYCIHNVKVEITKSEYNKIHMFQRTSYIEELKKSEKYNSFKTDYIEIKNLLESYFNSISNLFTFVNFELLYGKIHSLMSYIDFSELFNFLYLMHDGDVIYTHCLNVSLICNLFAQWAKMDNISIKNLTISAVLHDIGKLKISSKILLKKDKLSNYEYNEMKIHTIKGYELLLKIGYANIISEVALMHHERCDGTGYPYGRNINSIPDFAKLVMIADVYEAMTAVRDYRQNICPFNVIKEMESDALAKYDPKYSMIFFEKIATSYVNHTVRLNNGDTGIVTFINKNNLSNPIIKVENHFLDLAKVKDIYIEDVI